MANVYLAYLAFILSTANAFCVLVHAQFAQVPLNVHPARVTTTLKPIFVFLPVLKIRFLMVLNVMFVLITVPSVT